MDKDKSSSAFTCLLGFHILRGALLFVILLFLIQVALQIQALSRTATSSISSLSIHDLLSPRKSFPGEASVGDCDRALAGARSRLRDAVVFLPLKDAAPAVMGKTNIMRAMNDTFDGEQAQHLRFPSPASGGRLLCLAGNHTRDGTKNSYALAWPDALPGGAAFHPGMTFVSDNFYDYNNLWHGLAAVVPFVAWHVSMSCRRPARWVLYKRGELQREMSPWVRAIAEATMEEEMKMESFDTPTCFEEVVVFRHNEGLMSPEKKMQAYDTIRCKARAFCNATDSTAGEQTAAVRLTLLLRTGARSFKNDSAVIEIFRKACARAGDCRLTVAWAAKMGSFCDQVKLMSGTDVLASQHGAQLTNMIFMDRNSSVMEFFPSDWKHAAGAGQFVYHWLAANSGMRHRGAWRDPVGAPCNLPAEDRHMCFSMFHKNQQLGHDDDYFSNWTATVIDLARETKLSRASIARRPCTCLCE